MNSYSCIKCNAGLYSAAALEEPLCVECERDEAVASMKSPEEIKEKVEPKRAMANTAYWSNTEIAIYCEGYADALDWVLGVDE